MSDPGFTPKTKPDGLYQAGLTALQEARFADAAETFRQLVQIEPRSPRALYYYGCALNAISEPADALKQLDLALRMEPGWLGIYTQKSSALLEMNRSAAALSAADKAVALAPSNTEALCARASALVAMGRMSDAERVIENAINVNPTDLIVLALAGDIMSLLGKAPAARRLYDQVLRIAPFYADEMADHALLLMVRGKHEQGLRLCRRALAISPTSIVGLNILGFGLMKLERYAQAREAYLQGLRLAPANAEIWCNLGTALVREHKHGEALEAYNRSLAVDPHYRDGLIARGRVFSVLKHHQEALQDYKAALELKPDDVRIKAMMATSLAQVCDWRDRHRLLAEMAANLHAGGVIVEAFDSLALYDDPLLHKQCAQIALGLTADSPVQSWSGKRAKGKIRLGYLSADLRLHPVAQLMAEVFQAHDRSKFEVVALSTHLPESDRMHIKLRKIFDEFYDVGHLPDAELAQFISSKNIEILIDLGGLTNMSRTFALAARPAPVQVNFLGFPGTLGAPFIDYIIGDATVIPPGAEDLYVENVVRLPDAYLPGGGQGVGKAGDRQKHGLPEDAVVFCVFNPGYKITPEAFSSWIRILDACPGSVLWLPGNDAVRQNLEREAKASGFDPKRLVFAPFAADIEDHLARLSLADIALDTAPYGSHTTAVDALWAGVPLVTSAGPTFASRVGASLVRVAGLPELDRSQAQDLESYTIALAKNPALRADMRTRLLAARKTSPLFDTARFTRHLEAAYAGMSARHRRGEPPASFDVPQSA